MCEKTSTKKSPWVIVKGNEREYMRIEAMKYILSLFDYTYKSKYVGEPDAEAIRIFDAVDSFDDFI